MTGLEVIREVHPSARIAPDVTIGDYCVVGPDVTIGPGSVLVRRVSVTGLTTIGSQNRFEEGCVLGAAPQDLKYKGERSLLIIGHRNLFGRCATAHVGTEMGGYLTRIGDGNVLADGCHVAHDCYVDDNTRMGRSVCLGGHIRVHTGAVIDDLAGVHHFVTIGRYARVGARTPVRRDVPPYCLFHTTDHAQADAPAIKGVHEEGIRAAGLRADEERELRKALRELFADESALQTKIEQLVNLGVEGEVADLCEFCQRSLRGLYGRHRESYRGKAPPEAEKYLPPELQARARRSAP